jgi:uncharacterized protein YcsI (UPF0317 family)
MLSKCANPGCGKPLHYLREGRIFVFDLPDPNLPLPASGKAAPRLRHFWLCGICSETMVMEQTDDKQVRVARKARKGKDAGRDFVPDLQTI